MLLLYQNLEKHNRAKLWVSLIIIAFNITLFGSNLVLAGGNARAEGAESGANAPRNQ